MSFAAAFDSAGRCKYVVDGELDTIDFSQEAAVVVLENTVSPDSIWYDHETGQMRGKAPFPVSVSNNKIEGVPAGTTARVGDETFLVDTGVIELEVDYPEVVRVWMSHIRYLDVMLEVPCEIAS